MHGCMQQTTPDLLVVGAGVIGLGVADAAAREGLRVTVLERERPAARASWAGAGMLNCRPWPRVNTPDYQDLVLSSKRRFPEWAERLRDETDIDIGLTQCGALELYPEARATPDGLANMQRMIEGCHARGVRVERVSPAEARELEPGLNTDGMVTAVHLPDDGQLRTPRFGKALVLSCRQREVVLREGVDVADVLVDGGKARGVITRRGETIPSGTVVLCPGAWTGQFPTLNQLVPRTGKIHPVRGQIVCFQAPRPVAQRLFTVEHHYIVPRPDGITLVGSTMERVGFEAVTTPEGVTELQSFGARLIPALSGLKPMTTWADLRPGLKGVHPILGPVPGVSGLLVAAGHFRNGLVLTPITAEIVVALVQGKTLPMAIDPWLPKGPGGAVPKEDEDA